MFEFFSRLCSNQKLSPLEAELLRQRKLLKSISSFVCSIQRCLKYWDRSAKVLKCGTATYFEDKPTYQRPVQEITSALDSLRTILLSVKPQLDLLKNANAEAAKLIANAEKANRRKRDAEVMLSRRETKLKSLKQRSLSGKDPNAAQKVKAAEDATQVARSNLQVAEAELCREVQQTMCGCGPQAAMQVARALEAMLLILSSSGIDMGLVRSSIRLLEETPYLSPLAIATAANNGQQQMQHQQSLQQQLMLQSSGDYNKYKLDQSSSQQLPYQQQQQTTPPCSTPDPQYHNHTTSAYPSPPPTPDASKKCSPLIAAHQKDPSANSIVLVDNDKKPSPTLTNNPFNTE